MMRTFVNFVTIAAVTAAMTSACGCAAVAEIINPPTRADLIADVRLARKRETQFDDVYKNPSAYTRSEQNLAVWNLPPIPVPKDCMQPGSAATLECLRYAARLHSLPVFVSSSVNGSLSGALSPAPYPEGY
jgi:hypothetical protein